VAAEDCETVPLQEYLAAVRDSDLRFEAERDRRYTEVNQEREKAIRIKETAERRALELAREIQDYKDEKANELRSQIESERGKYVTQEQLVAITREHTAEIKPLTDFVASQQGRQGGQEYQRTSAGDQMTRAIAALSLLVAIVVAIVLIVHNSG
jgi:CHASE3 domain sensor protein